VKPGIYTGIPAEEYHSGPEVSASDLEILARSPAHLAGGFRSESSAFALGTAVHCAILEPHEFKNRYFLGEDGVRRGTKAWDALEAQANGRDVLKPSEWEMAIHVSHAVRHHPGGAMLLGDMGEPGLAEVSVYWEDDETGIPCRCRPDLLQPGRVCVDLKTAANASPGEFAKSIARYGYHTRAAFYLDGLEAVGAPVIDYMFLVVEKEPPYAVAVYSLDLRSIEQGRRTYRRLLDQYAHCNKSGQWPGYPEYQMLSLPAWAMEE
jgi:hypothetical protein